MNQPDFIRGLASVTGFKQKDLDIMLRATLKLITDKLAMGEDVKFSGFGSFETTKRMAREGINPRTKEGISIPATIVPKFYASKQLKDSVKQGEVAKKMVTT